MKNKKMYNGLKQRWYAYPTSTLSFYFFKINFLIVKSSKILICKPNRFFFLVFLLKKYLAVFFPDFFFVSLIRKYFSSIINAFPNRDMLQYMAAQFIFLSCNA